MKKCLKAIGWVVLGLIVLVLAAVLTLPLWIGPVVTSVANKIVPEKTQTEFNLGAFALNPYSGHLGIGDVRLGNPEGFDEKDAFRLGSLSVDLDVGSLATDVIHIREILIDDVFAFATLTGSNFKQIAANASGKGAGEASSEGGEAAGAEPPQVEEKEPVEEPAAESKPAKKVIIDHIRISNLTVKYGPMPIPLPSIELHDLGKESDGASWSDIISEIVGTVKSSLGIVGDGVKNLIGGVTNAVDEGVGKAAEALSGVTGEAGAMIEGAAGEAEAVLEDAGARVKEAGQKLKDAGSAIKGLFK